ncbi:MbnP family protein [Hymenobacter norwichensis]|uniref:MbnP family protein n=1 Tax=Hymenobacter norwichensis TaxID=223903 RepID=UPI0003B497E6|nr:MbnP family protein [Hymenobacter norwichensis]
MKFLKYTALFLALFSLSATVTSCDDDDNTNPAAVNIEFENVVGSNTLELNSATPYATGAGDQITVTAFRYFISNVKLKKADGTEWAQPESYYLIDQALPASKKISLTDVPPGDYTSLTFTIGVDSARNVAGAQTGALSKGNMFWDWNTGYVFMKLEGRSPQAPGAGAVILHVGGFRKGENAVRTVTPTLNNSVIRVHEGHTPEIHVKADIQKMFVGSTPIRFSSVNNLMAAGTNAVNISKNYENGMFVVDRIQGN